MARVNKTRLQVWAKTLIEDTECLNEVRDRFQLRLLEMFRGADKDKRDEINHIMDNEQMFFEELQAICDEIMDSINEPEDDPDEPNQ